MNGAPGEAEEVYPDSRAAFGGVILRGIWGPYLPYDDDVPQNGFLQRSNDGARTWGPPELFYDAENTMFWAKRLRPLRDGRWLAGGGLFFIHPEYDNRRGWFRDMTMALFVGDAEGRNWMGPISIIPDDQRGEFAGEEFDWAELEDGDLLCVLRTETLPTFDARDAGQQRRITRLSRSGESWKPTRVEMAPFPHSGHPDVLRTREGLVLHLATSAISASADDGQSWTHFELAPATAWQGWCGPGTPYYPKAVHLPNGEILVLGHVGEAQGVLREVLNKVLKRFVGHLVLVGPRGTAEDAFESLRVGSLDSLEGVEQCSAYVARSVTHIFPVCTLGNRKPIVGSRGGVALVLRLFEGFGVVAFPDIREPLEKE